VRPLHPVPLKGSFSTPYDPWIASPILPDSGKISVISVPLLAFSPPCKGVMSPELFAPTAVGKRFLSGQKHILHFKDSDGKSPCREDFQNLAVSEPKGNDTVLDPVLSCGFCRFHIHCPFCSRDRLRDALPFPLFVWTLGFFVRLLECPAVHRSNLAMDRVIWSFCSLRPTKNPCFPVKYRFEKHKHLFFRRLQNKCKKNIYRNLRNLQFFLVFVFFITLCKSTRSIVIHILNSPFYV